MLDPISLALIGSAVGGVKGSLDQEKGKEERYLKAIQNKWSPWTGVTDNSAITKGDPFGSAVVGGFGGFQQGLENQHANDYSSYLNDMKKNSDLASALAAAAANRSQGQAGATGTNPVATMSPYEQWMSKGPGRI